MAFAPHAPPLRQGCGNPTQYTGSAVTVVAVVGVDAVVAAAAVDVVGMGGGAKVVAAVNAPTIVVVVTVLVVIPDFLRDKAGEKMMR